MNIFGEFHKVMKLVLTIVSPAFVFFSVSIVIICAIVVVSFVMQA